jgi:hypothetical protein
MVATDDRLTAAKKKKWPLMIYTVDAKTLLLINKLKLKVAANV